LQRLNSLAAALEAKEPNLTKEQAFTRVYTDPANKELVAGASRHFARALSKRKEPRIARL
jgi:hypothetical protein